MYAYLYIYKGTSRYDIRDQYMKRTMNKQYPYYYFFNYTGIKKWL